MYEILIEIMKLHGVLFRQKVQKGPPAVEVLYDFLFFCCYFCLGFINLVLVFSSAKNLQVEGLNATLHFCFLIFFHAREKLGSCSLQNLVEGLLCFRCHLAF